MDKQLEEEARLQRAVFPVLPHPSGTSTHTGNNELPSPPECTALAGCVFQTTTASPNKQNQQELKPPKKRSEG